MEKKDIKKKDVLVYFGNSKKEYLEVKKEAELTNVRAQWVKDRDLQPFYKMVSHYYNR